MDRQDNHLWQQILSNINRKGLMFAVGATIALHETFTGSGLTERPFLLALAGGLMGLPFVISADQRREEGENREEK